jgi:glycosyltransferase involved in cell wall biosynthesis
MRSELVSDRTAQPVDQRLWRSRRDAIRPLGDRHDPRTRKSSLLRHCRAALKVPLLVGVLLACLPLTLASLILASWSRTPHARDRRRLVVITPFTPGDQSGFARAVKDLTTVLAPRVEQVDVVTVAAAMARPGWVRRQLSSLVTWPLPVPRYCRGLLFGHPGLAEAVARHADAVLVEGLAGALFLTFVRVGGPRIVLRDHEVMARVIALQCAGARFADAVAQRLRLGICYLLSLAIYRRVDRIVTLTDDDRDWILQRFPGVHGRVSTIPVPVSCVDAESTARPTAPVRDLVMVGNFFHRPNVDALLWFCRECAPHLRHRFTLHVCGLDKPLHGMQLDCDRLTVVRHGFVQDIASVADRAPIALAPVVSGGGVRMKNLMLAARGHVVVTTRLGNEGIGFVDGRDAVVCDDGREMAQRIDELSESPAALERIAANGRAYVRGRFRADGIADRFERQLFA